MSRARLLVGQLVGLCCAPPAEGSSEQAGSPALLHCLGLGYVRFLDEESRQLHILSPVPLVVAAQASALVPWRGASDLPATLLYRASPEGDAFCFHPASVASFKSGAGAAGAEGVARKNLKRRRLTGGGGSGRG
jgi:hypothetical protein